MYCPRNAGTVAPRSIVRLAHASLRTIGLETWAVVSPQSEDVFPALQFGDREPQSRLLRDLYLVTIHPSIGPVETKMSRGTRCAAGQTCCDSCRASGVVSHRGPRPAIRSGRQQGCWIPPGLLPAVPQYSLAWSPCACPGTQNSLPNDARRRQIANTDLVILATQRPGTRIGSSKPASVSQDRP
jgi:hypothetical protein